MVFALVGNPNSGKTTLFNELTKLNQKIGNWPGVTIEKKEGRYFLDKEISIIDLPGVYSLNPITQEEIITCNYLKSNKPDAVINVVDSTNLSRNLALTLQLLETGIPVVLALNMEDELKINGLTLDKNAIETHLQVKAVLISALKNRHLTDLIEAAKSETVKKREIFINPGKNEEERAEYRHNFIKERIDLFRVKTVSKSKLITDKIDKIVLNKWLAYPIFAFVIWLMYFISIQTVGALSVDGMNWIFNGLIGENLRKALTSAGASPWIISLTVDAVIKGVGSVLSFIPQIIILFLFITFLENCGYMSRVALIMDRIFRKIGLSGKSFIPMIVGCGCSVPAIMSAKTIEGDIERKTTIMLTPFVPCSAKLPVFALIAGALFPNNSFVAPSMYFLGIFMIILCGLILKMFWRKKSSDDTFIMELSPYRMPKPKNILLELWDKAKGFIIRAGVIIVPATVILWLLQSFSFSFEFTDIENSMLASIGKVIAPVFIPLGFGNWQSSIAVITGFFAKETIVATFGVLLSGYGNVSAGLNELFTPWSAYAFMAFVLLSAPCIAAIAATKKEMGSKKWMFITIGFQFFIGYITALIINQLGNAWLYNKPLFITILTTLIVAVVFLICLRYLFKNKKAGGCFDGCGGCKYKNNCSLQNDSEKMKAKNDKKI